MFRYNFVPLEEMQDGRIAIAVADPSQLLMFDEISLLLASGLSSTSPRSPDQQSPEQGEEEPYAR
jgi:hypothetical protein